MPIPYSVVRWFSLVLKVSCRGLKSFSVLCILTHLVSCNSGTSSEKGGGVVVTTVPSSPSSLSLVTPGSSPGLDSTPTISVGGVVSGNTVKLFSDSACTTEIGSGVSLGTSVNITVSSALSVSTHTIYAKATNSKGSSPCSSLSVSYTLASCPADFIPVPHNSSVGTMFDFCVMKYEAKAYNSVGQTIVADGCNGCMSADWGLADHYPVSSSIGLPWRRITATQASAECNSLNSENGVTDKYDLISNPEWMSIARNVEGVDENWETSTPGSGAMFRGHTDNSPALPLSSSTDDNDVYSQTGNTNSEVMGSGKEQKRTLILSNGEVLWDFSGNVYEWVDWSHTTSGFNLGPVTCTPSWTQLPNVNCAELSLSQYIPSITTLDSNNGVGRFFGGTGGAARRGGGWDNGSSAGSFGLILGDSTMLANNIIGFRCVYRP